MRESTGAENGSPEEGGRTAAVASTEAARIVSPTLEIPSMQSDIGIAHNTNNIQQYESTISIR